MHFLSLQLTKSSDWNELDLGKHLYQLAGHGPWQFGCRLSPDWNEQEPGKASLYSLKAQMGSTQHKGDRDFAKWVGTEHIFQAQGMDSALGPITKWVAPGIG